MNNYERKKYLKSKYDVTEHYYNKLVNTYKHMKERVSNPEKGLYYGKGCTMSLEDIFIIWRRDNGETLTYASIDRINPEKGYHFNNCRFIEFKENMVLAHKNAMKKIQKPVKQLTLDGRVIAEYVSAHEASRQTGFHRPTISAVCGKSRYKHTAGGYKWEYV